MDHDPILYQKYHFPSFKQETNWSWYFLLLSQAICEESNNESDSRRKKKNGNTRLGKVNWNGGKKEEQRW